MTKLVKAHIIPEAFFRALWEGGETPLLVSGNASEFIKRAPIGVYDEGILCEACEAKFSRVDSYGVEVLLNRFDELFAPIEHTDTIVAYQAKGIDQKLLLQFLIATLWRASVSTHRYYNRVDLGPYELIARQSILDAQNDLPILFGAVLSRWTVDQKHDHSASGLMNPFREKWDGVNAYRFYFGLTVGYIKVDPRPFPKPLSELALQAQPHVSVVTRSFSKSKDFAAMVHTVKHSCQQPKILSRPHSNKRR
jgi:hypothetical protein